MNPQHLEGRPEPDGHIDLEELADAAEGLVEPGRAREISAHLDRCDQCRADAGALSGVQASLAAAAPVTMPDVVFARLQGVLVEEHRHRRAAADGHDGARDGARRNALDRLSDGVSDGATDGRLRQGRSGLPPYDGHGVPNGVGNGLPKIGGRFPKPHLAEHFVETVRRRHRRARFAGGAVAAALLASTVGFGGYVLSASAGTAEPPTDQPVVLQESTLGATASSLVKHADLDPYRFTRAWLCVRKVTDGRITGIRSSVLDGRPGYLVFLHKDDAVRAVFVSGCDTDEPQAGPSATVQKS